MNLYRLRDSATGRLLGVAKTADIQFVRMSAANIPVLAKKDDTQIFGVVINDTIYALDTVSQTSTEYPRINLSYITQEEYNELYPIFEKLLPTPEGSVAVPGVESKLELAKEVRLSELKEEARSRIYSGITLTINDCQKTFELTIEDQINLNTMQNQILRGVTEFKYHAKDELATHYSADVIQQIIDAANAHVTSITLQFNALKHVVASCTTVEQVNQITFDTTIDQ